MARKTSAFVFPGAVGGRSFTQGVGGFHGHPNGFAISPDGERPAALLNRLRELDDAELASLRQALPVLERILEGGA